MWVDNFNDLFLHKVAQLGKPNMSLCQWTVFGSIRYNGEEEVSMSFVKNVGTHTVIHATPPNPFIHVDEANKLLAASQGADLPAMGMPLLFDQCLFSSCKLNRVPLKLDPANIPPLLRHVLQDNGRPLHNFFPGGVSDDNIGSNAGLAVVIQRIWEQRGMRDGTCEKYLVLSADINIFMRVAKVCFFLCRVSCRSLRHS